MILGARSRWVKALAIAAVLAGTPALHAHAIWSGLGNNSNWTNPANWQANVAPPNDGTEDVTFGPATRTSVLVNTSQSLLRLTFDFSTARLSYSLSASTGATLTLGSEGLYVLAGAAPAVTGSAVTATTGGGVTFDSSLGIVLGANQTWTVGSDSSVKASGTVSGAGRLTLSGDGYVELAGSNTYTGGTVLESVSVGVENNSAFGTGAVTVTGAARLYANSGARTLANALNLNSNLFDLLPYGGDLRFSGAVTLGANTTLRNYGSPVYFNGPIGETGGARMLSVAGDGAIVLAGTNTYTGGTAVYDGYLFFSNASSVPATGALTTDAAGYIGIGFNTGVQSGFLSKFAVANTYGTIGFDTSTAASSVTIFNEPVDLSTFNASARIGSVTRATLSSTAVITPSTTGGYRFGGGGGTLQVESKLSGSSGLTVDSTSSGSMTLYLTNTTNDYSGATSVTESALVFAAGAASPNSAAGSYTMGTGGYIGTQDLALLPSTWIGKFAASTLTGVIGFDTTDLSSGFPVGSAIVPIDLTRFTASGSSIALGTATAANLAGTVILPASQPDYYFTGYKGGWLTVSSSLSGSGGVRLGDAFGNYPEYDPADLTRMSSVFLNGNNTHTGGTTLFSGRLVIGHANALGTGSLTIDGSAANALPRLETSMSTTPTFANSLVVKDDFEVGGVSAFNWSGAIANGVNTGTIRKYGAFNLTLSGNNSGFSGGFLIQEGTITFASDTAAGTGGLNLGSGSGIAAFTSAFPSLSSLSGDSTASQVTLGNGTTLTVSQTGSTTFRGQIQGTGGIAKTGAGLLRLTSANPFSGGTTITAGTLQVGTTGGLGTGAVTLNGATSQLRIDSGVTLSNAIVFGASGGKLSGHGTFGSNVVLGTNTIISPGSSVGTLTFTTGLTLTSGGAYDFEIQDATGGPGVGWDFVQVNGPLTFTATVGSPFTLNLISLNSGGASGNPANFSSGNAYSWTILSATSLVGFNPAAVTLSTAGFTSALNGGTFSLASSGNNILLNFTPVPEPSTWALMLAGFGVVGLRALRRRK